MMQAEVQGKSQMPICTQPEERATTYKGRRQGYTPKSGGLCKAWTNTLTLALCSNTCHSSSVCQCNFRASLWFIWPEACATHYKRDYRKMSFGTEGLCHHPCTFICSVTCDQVFSRPSSPTCKTSASTTYFCSPCLYLCPPSFSIMCLTPSLSSTCTSPMACSKVYHGPHLLL